MRGVPALRPFRSIRLSVRGRSPGSRFLPGRSPIALPGQGQDRVAPHHPGLGHPPLLIEQIGRRGTHVQERPLEQRMVLLHQQDRAFQARLLGQSAVRLGVVQADQDELHVGDAEIALQACQIRGEQLRRSRTRDPRRSTSTRRPRKSSSETICPSRSGRRNGAIGVPTASPCGSAPARHGPEPLVQGIEAEEDPSLLLDHLVEDAPQAEQDERLERDEDRHGALHGDDR